MAALKDPLRLDPSRTLGLRRAFAADFVRRIESIRRAAVRLIDNEDAFGLKDRLVLHFNPYHKGPGAQGGQFTTTHSGGRGNTRQSVGRDWLILNTRWKFKTDADKMESFRQWIENQIKQRLLEKDEVGDIWTKRYIEAAYKKGKVRGSTQAAIARRQQYEHFITETAQQRRKLETLLKRSLNDLDGFSSKMTTDATRIIADGLNRGDSSTKIARALSKKLDIEKTRAMTIARTETVRAQSEGQLDAFDEAGITHVSALVEWVTAAGQGATVAEMEAAGVCRLCRPLSGVVMTIKEARGLIPRHPQCRCAWEAVVVGDLKDLLRTKRQIQGAIRRSVMAGGSTDWSGGERSYKTKPIPQAGKRRQGRQK